MASSRQYVLDGACTGRYAPPVVDALVAYTRYQSMVSTDNCHRFHLGGINALTEDGAQDVPDEVLAPLAAWGGFDRFEQDLCSLAVPAPRSWLVGYGLGTLDAIDAIVGTMRGSHLFVGTDVYQPWRSAIAEARVRGDLAVSRCDTLHYMWECDPATAAAAIANEIQSVKPDVVVMSLVTQHGVRVPVERVARCLQAVSAGASLPIFVIDACQAVGRVPFSLGPASDGLPQGVVVGCLHKAVRGPKEMAFVICSSARLRSALAAALGRRAGLTRYARSRGEDITLPTVDIQAAVGGAAAIKTLRETGIGSIPRPMLNQLDVESTLRPTHWRVRGPKHTQYKCGIVLLEPPAAVASTRSRHGLRELLLPQLIVDELDGCARIAFDWSHPPEAGRDVAKILEDVADLAEKRS